MADVKRIIRMRDDKQAMAALVQKGSLGDETVARFALAEKELEAELLDVISEANTFREGWGQLIFPTAGEMVAHLKHKEVYYGVATQRDDEKLKLQEAGKPVPQSRVPLPPLVTPPGTQIQVQMPAQPGPANGHAAPANAEQAEIAAAAQAAGLPPGFLQAAQQAAAMKQQQQQKLQQAGQAGKKQVTVEEEEE
ncbi:Preprotein translocase subunit Sec66 [Ceraceosorus bombacis]|uniref:Preprotein translocase subunit Sec66 n=1 Tax=Ceraceosorus bombacis TaxID=401625 RepID=A0A0P1BMW3_9BASI|nr:Preprotein translocase subunit Sec66 [Ceraceosorus bombacis]